MQNGHKDNEKYYSEQDKINITKMREVLITLPHFCKQYFRGIEEVTSARTRLGYAYDLRTFFEFLHEQNSFCKKMEIPDYKISLLDQITRENIEEYLHKPKSTTYFFEQKVELLQKKNTGQLSSVALNELTFRLLNALDLDAQTGGYNLQIAWTTGYVAGSTIKEGAN